MRASVLLVLLAVVVAVAGCGGGTGSSGWQPTDPSATREWTFTQGDTSTMAVWSKPVTDPDGSGFSVVLKKNGDVEVVAYGGMAGYATGTADEDGNITTTSSFFGATGNLTHELARVGFYIPGVPSATAPMNASPVETGSYNPFRGTWHGMFVPLRDVNTPMRLTVDEAGMVRGTLGESSPDIVSSVTFIYGFVDPQTKTMTLKKLVVNNGPLTFTGTIDSQASPMTVSGTVKDSTLGTNKGSWSATRQ